jgi:nanoRNase/pAp phosphatase (c-di-AMP/oligoRNAs hydrolase)
MARPTISGERRLRALLQALEGAQRVLVLTHNNPDPDGLSSALALQKVIAAQTDLRVEIGYGGIIGRTENQAMVENLRIDLIHFNLLEKDSFDAYALVDTQPGTGNNSLPEGTIPRIVIDHHPIRRQTRKSPFHDVRHDLGATATMMSEYVEAAGIKVDATLATALFYGIKSETQNLVRSVTRKDLRAYLRYFALSDRSMIGRIEHAPVSRNYFEMLARAIRGARLYDGVAVARMGRASPDMVAECADLFLRLDDARWALCMGRFHRALFLSLRTKEEGADAGVMIQKVVGRDGSAGGHGLMAGGMVPLPFASAGAAKPEDEIVARFLKLLHVKERVGEPLVRSGRARGVTLPVLASGS